MTDEEFREAHKPLHVPAHYVDATDLTGKVAFALADLGEGSADEIIRRLENLEPAAEVKPLITHVHGVLDELFEKGAISAEAVNGTKVYNLHKITRANDGSVDPASL